MTSFLNHRFVFFNGCANIGRDVRYWQKIDKKVIVCMSVRAKSMHFQARKNVTIYHENIDHFFVSDLRNMFV